MLARADVDVAAMSSRLTPEEAAFALEIPLEGLTVEQVNKAYREQVFACHPDTGQTLGPDWTILRDAKSTLLRYLTGASKPCPVCDGEGSFISGWTVLSCPSCKGGVK